MTVSEFKSKIRQLDKLIALCLTTLDKSKTQKPKPMSRLDYFPHHQQSKI